MRALDELMKTEKEFFVSNTVVQQRSYTISEEKRTAHNAPNKKNLLQT